MKFRQRGRGPSGTTTADRIRQFVRTAAVRVGDWVYTQKAIAPEASAKAAEFYAEASLTFLYREARLGRPL